jgi:dethiobiotin synthetase
VIVAVTGTGTGIGKTHVACALLGALRDRGVRAVGYKPVESGVDPGAPETDEALLRAASGGTVAAPTLRLRAPLSPHLAARREGKVIDGARIRATLAALPALYEVVVLELAGGLCSPFDERIDNVDVLSAFAPRTILVAPDRLGVLHDVSAAVRAAAAVELDLHAITLVAPAAPDDSTTTNAAEIPRTPVDELRRHPAIVELAATLVE